MAESALGAAFTTERSNTLATALKVLRRRWWIVAALVLLGLGLAIARYETATKHYDATASVSFDNVSLSDAALQVSQGSGDPTRDAATNVLIVTSLQVASAVRQQLHSSATPQDLLKLINVQAAPNANVLEITASTTSPVFSAQLANAFAQQYLAFKTQSQVASIDAAQAQLQRQLATVSPTSPTAVGVQQSLQRLAELRAVATGDAQVISRAVAPHSHSGLSLPASGALGVLIGLAVALLLVFVIESLDRRIDSIEEIEREYRLPLLAVIPQRAFRQDSAVDREEQLEPYRILRSAIELEEVTRKLDTLLITSATTGEGKTTVAIDLAHAIALTGRRVTLLELDLRRPTFGNQTGVDPRRGVTTVLSGQDTLEDTLVRPFEELPEFFVLPSGPLPVRPAELMESSGVSQLLNDLVTPGGIVVIDTPPLNPVADTHVLLSNAAVDAAIIVARIRFVTQEDIRHARAVLDRHMLEPIGVVVTGMRGGGPYGYSRYASVELDTIRDRDNKRGMRLPLPARSTPVSSRAGRE